MSGLGATHEAESSRKVNSHQPCRYLGPVHKQSQVNYNEFELQFKSISLNFIG